MSPAGVSLDNGLVRRDFKVSPTFGTVGLEAMGENLLRSFKPEVTLQLDGKLHQIGGYMPPKNRAFITTEDQANPQPLPSEWKFVGWEPAKPSTPFAWKRARGAAHLGQAWPPKGVGLVAIFTGPSGLRLEVRYELYDGIPLLMKSFQLKNLGDKSIRVDRFIGEQLAVVEAESIVDKTPEWKLPNLTVLTDYSFGGMAPSASNRTVYWVPDREYTTQVNYELVTPVDLEVRPPLGPGVRLHPGASFKSFRVFCLGHDTNDRERQGLALRRLYRTIAPWVTENPIMLHLTSTDPSVVRAAIDQAAECGFEMIVISFWSGLDMEDLSESNLAKFREFREYANSKGLELGGYSLLASRRIDDENDVINPKTGKTGGAIFGQSPCLQSKWGQEYFAKITRFLDATGFQLLEHDGNYPGDVCASTTHPGHEGLEDSQWRQFELIRDLYHRCRERGVFLNVPDNYFLAGSNKTGMGYRESNWSLPRAQQHLHARQNLFDGTWDKTPTMGWMMTPLVEYQGGGSEATIEPLKDHLEDYGLHLANNFGYGAQSCYRGPRLYDTPETKALVVKWVSWFKQNRRILESDVVHVRRADGRNLDAILHVNPQLETRGLAMVWNPTAKPLEQELTFPLHYTGIRGEAKISIREGRKRTVSLDAQHRVRLRLKLEPREAISIVFEQK